MQRDKQKQRHLATENETELTSAGARNHQNMEWIWGTTWRESLDFLLPSRPQSHRQRLVRPFWNPRLKPTSSEVGITWSECWIVSVHGLRSSYPPCTLRPALASVFVPGEAHMQFTEGRWALSISCFAHQEFALPGCSWLWGCRHRSMDSGPQCFSPTD